MLTSTVILFRVFQAGVVVGALTVREAIQMTRHTIKITYMAGIADTGDMLNVSASVDTVKDILSSYHARHIGVAGVNSPNNTTISGDNETLQQVARTLQQRGVSALFLKVGAPFHCLSAMGATKQYWGACTAFPLASRAPPKVSPAVGYFSSCRGHAGLLKNSLQQLRDHEYWWTNVADRVCFEEAVHALMQSVPSAVLLEVAPRPVLTPMISDILGVRDKHYHLVAPPLSMVAASARRFDPTSRCMAALHRCGVPLRWRGVYPAPSARYRNVSRLLPKYAWQRRSFWAEAESRRAERMGIALAPAESLLNGLLVADSATNGALASFTGQVGASRNQGGCCVCW